MIVCIFLVKFLKLRVLVVGFPLPIPVTNCGGAELEITQSNAFRVAHW